MTTINKKLCFFLYSLEESNGTERAVVNLVNNLVNDDFDISIISLLKQNRSCDFYIDPRVKLKDLDIIEKNKIQVYFEFFFRMFKIGYFNYFIGTLVYINIILSFFSKVKKIKVIACEHVPYYHPNKIIIKIRRYMYKSTYKIVCLNECEAIHFRKYFHNVVIIPNTINIRYKKTKIEHNIILCVSRFSHEKGIDLLLNILSDFYKNKSNLIYQTHIIGDGPLFNEIKNNLYLSGFEKNIKLLGRISNVEEYYKLSDVVVVPSRYEGFGLVIAEAMSFGVPVVSFNVPTGPKYIINDGVNGYLIPPFDISLFSEKLSLLLNNKEQLSKFSKNTKFSLNKFSSLNVVILWKNIL